jgi:hypothetical protein
MSRLLVLIALVLAALALVAAGCGDDDDDGDDATEQSATTGDGFSTEEDDEDAVGTLPDAEAKLAVRGAVPAIEVYATDNGGSYEGATVEALQAIDPTFNEDLVITIPMPQAYEIELTAESGVTYTVTKGEDGALVQPCDPPGEGLCPDSGEW